MGCEGQMDRGANATISGDGLKVVRKTVALWIAYIDSIKIDASTRGYVII